MGFFDVLFGKRGNLTAKASALAVVAGISFSSIKQAQAASPLEIKGALVAVDKADDWIKVHPDNSKE